MKLKLFAIFLIFFFSCNNEERNTSYNEEWYKKKIIELDIHLVRIYEYEFRFGKPDEKTRFLVELSEYDKNGNIIRTENYHRTEILRDYDIITTLSYDKNGFLIEKLETNTKGELKSLIKYKNENGLNTERVFYNPEGEITGKTFYKYDNSNNCIELVSYDEKGEIDYKKIMKYNKNNEEIESKTFNKEGDIKSSTKLIQLNDGWKKYQFFDEKNELKYEYSYILNENNIITESVWKDIETGREDKTINEIDENGLIIKITEYENHGEPKRLKEVERSKY